MRALCSLLAIAALTAAPAIAVPPEPATQAAAIAAIKGLRNASDPLPTKGPTPTTIVTFQLALTAGARQQLPATALVNGLVCKASAVNPADVLIGGSNTVTVAADGTGTGYPLAPGESASFAAANSNAAWAISSAAAVLFCQGN